MKQVADFVVKYLTPYYKDKRFASKVTLTYLLLDIKLSNNCLLIERQNDKLLQ